MQSKLFDYLTNHSDQALNSIPQIELSQLCKKTDINSMEDILNHFEIWSDSMITANLNLEVLKLVQSKQQVIIFKIFAFIPMWISLLFFIIYPLAIENYWYYFFILLMPLSIMASGTLKSPFKPLFWLVFAVLLATSIILKSKVLLPIIVVYFLLKTLPQQAKKFYKNSIINAAIKDKLKFKFLFTIGMVNLYEPSKNKLIKYE